MIQPYFTLYRQEFFFLYFSCPDFFLPHYLSFYSSCISSFSASSALTLPLSSAHLSPPLFVWGWLPCHLAHLASELHPWRPHVTRVSILIFSLFLLLRTIVNTNEQPRIYTFLLMHLSVTPSTSILSILTPLYPHTFMTCPSILVIPKLVAGNLLRGLFAYCRGPKFAAARSTG